LFSYTWFCSRSESLTKCCKSPLQATGGAMAAAGGGKHTYLNIILYINPFNWSTNHSKTLEYREGLLCTSEHVSCTLSCGHTVWLRDPKIVEKIAHSRGYTKVKLEFEYHFKWNICLRHFVSDSTDCPEIAGPPCTIDSKWPKLFGGGWQLFSVIHIFSSSSFQAEFFLTLPVTRDWNLKMWRRDRAFLCRMELTGIRSWAYM
jgi:hypothetical protein